MADGRDVEAAVVAEEAELAEAAASPDLRRATSPGLRESAASPGLQASATTRQMHRERPQVVQVRHTESGSHGRKVSMCFIPPGYRLTSQKLNELLYNAWNSK